MRYNQRQTLSFLPYLVFGMGLLMMGFIFERQVVDLPLTYYNDEADIIQPSTKMASQPLTDPLTIEGIVRDERLLFGYSSGYKHLLSYAYILATPALNLFMSEVKLEEIYMFPGRYLMFARLLNWLTLAVLANLLIRLVRHPLWASLAVIWLLGNSKVLVYLTFAKADLLAATLAFASFYYFNRFRKEGKSRFLFALFFAGALASITKLIALPVSLTIALLAVVLAYHKKGRAAVPSILMSGIGALFAVFLIVPFHFLNIDQVYSSLDSLRSMTAGVSGDRTVWEKLGWTTIHTLKMTWFLYAPIFFISWFLFVRRPGKYLNLGLISVALVFHVWFFKNSLVFEKNSHHLFPALPLMIYVSITVMREIFENSQISLQQKWLSRIGTATIAIFSFIMAATNISHARSIVRSQLRKVDHLHTMARKISKITPVCSNVLRYRRGIFYFNPYLFNVRVGSKGPEKYIGWLSTGKLFAVGYRESLLGPLDYDFSKRYRLLNSSHSHHYYLLKDKENVVLSPNPYCLSAQAWLDGQSENSLTTYIPQLPPYGYLKWAIYWDQLSQLPTDRSSLMSYVPLSKLTEGKGSANLTLRWDDDFEDSMDSSHQLESLTVYYQNLSGVNIKAARYPRLPVTLSMDVSETPQMNELANVLLVFRAPAEAPIPREALRMDLKMASE